MVSWDFYYYAVFVFDLEDGLTLKGTAPGPKRLLKAVTPKGDPDQTAIPLESKKEEDVNGCSTKKKYS